MNEKLLLKFLERSIESEESKERVKAFEIVKIFVLALSETENEQKDKNKISDIFE